MKEYTEDEKEKWWKNQKEKLNIAINEEDVKNN